MNESTYRAPAEGAAEKVEDEPTQIHAVCAWCRFCKKSKKDEPLVSIAFKPSKRPPSLLPHYRKTIVLDGNHYALLYMRAGGPNCVAGVRVDPVLGKPDARSRYDPCTTKNVKGQCTDYVPTVGTWFRFWRRLPMDRKVGGE